LREWARRGIADVQVICPGFSADCLETLEEIAIQNREQFLGHGGRRFSYVPALNESPAHIDALAGVVLRHIAGREGNADTGQREAAGDRARSMDETS
jgi:ferrochelatase